MPNNGVYGIKLSKLKIIGICQHWVAVMTFKISLINNICPQQRKNPFNSSKLPEGHSSQQTKNEQSKNGRTGFFQTSKEGKYFYELDIFIFVICGQREILRVPFTQIISKRKWKVLMVFLFYYACWFPSWGRGSRNFRNW